MQYMGGKQRISRHLAEIIDSYRSPGQPVWDAFCGGLSMSAALSQKGPVLSSDICVPLICLYQSIKDGWIPPAKEITRLEYEAAKTLDDTDPLKAFIGFGCSFGGKWFGGYAGGTNGHSPLTYTQLAARNVVESVENCFGDFRHIDFLECSPSIYADCLFPSQSPRFVLYLDPPYKDTTTYGYSKSFDYQKFIARVEEWSQFHIVLVSEYKFPLGERIWTSKTITRLDKTEKSKERVDALFVISNSKERR
jgi:DNA adenine methylase